MSHQHRSRVALAAIVCAIAAAPMALASGEPKNDAPFTRASAVHVMRTTTASPVSPAAVSGEPKNQLPFTRPVGKAASTLSAARRSSARIQTLRFFDKPVSMRLTHADGTVVAHAPFPVVKPGDTLDIDSLEYVGTHVRHAAKWTASAHTRCVFRTGAPACESHVAIGSSLLVFSGEPSIVSDGTGAYQGASGRVLSNKEVGNNASDIVARIRLAPR